MSGVLAALTHRLRSLSLIRASWVVWLQRRLTRRGSTEFAANRWVVLPAARLFVCPPLRGSFPPTLSICMPLLLALSRRAKFAIEVYCAWRSLSQLCCRAWRVCNLSRYWRRAAALDTAFFVWKGSSHGPLLAAAAVRRMAARHHCVSLVGALCWWVEASHTSALTWLVAEAGRRMRSQRIGGALWAVRAGSATSDCIANSGCAAVDGPQSADSPGPTCLCLKVGVSELLALPLKGVWQQQQLSMGERRRRRLRAALRGWSGLAGAAVRAFGKSLLGRGLFYSNGIFPPVGCVRSTSNSKPDIQRLVLSAIYLWRNIAESGRAIYIMALSTQMQLQRHAVSSTFWWWSMFIWVYHRKQRRFSNAHARFAHSLAKKCVSKVGHERLQDRAKRLDD
jgi:hypothetical protein